jgi:hypothetical protein
LLVSSASQLVAAVKAGVLSILLAPGNYTDLHINDIYPAQPIIISSQSVSAMSVIDGCLSINRVADLTFSNIVFDFKNCADPYWPARVNEAKNIKFQNDEFKGAGPTSSAGGVLLVDSDNAKVVNSKFHHLGSVALNISRARNLTINGNDFLDWSKSAVGIGEVHTLEFTNNWIHDAYPLPGVHPDGLQIFTTHTKSASENLSIVGNNLDSGKGGAFQGIFIQDEERDKPYRNVYIARNNIIGGMWNSIYLKSATGNVSILYNTAFSSSQWNPTATTDAGHPVKTSFSAGILIWLLPDAVLDERGNAAQRFSTRDGRASPPPPGNSFARGGG